MKKILSVGLLMLIALTAVVMVGCKSTTTIMEFDKDGKLTKKTETSESPIMTIEKSLKNKMVVFWGDGLSMSGSVSPGSTENPMVHVEGKFRNGNGGGATIPQNMKSDAIKAVAKVIQATKSSAKMGITSDGVSISGKQEKDETQSTTTESTKASSASSTKDTDAASDIKNSEAIK